MYQICGAPVIIPRYALGNWWSLNHYHTLDIAKEKDALILSRYAGIGSHRSRWDSPVILT